MNPYPRNRSQRGFTLLEAIVTLVLIATTGMALLSWVNTNLISLQRIQAVQSRQEATRNALAFINTINPNAQQEGDKTIGVYTIRWSSYALRPMIDSLTRVGVPGLYKAGLYQIHVIVEQNKEILAEFDIRQPGYKQVHDGGIHDSF